MSRSVAVDLDQPGVADPEVVRDLVPDDVADLSGESRRIEDDGNAAQAVLDFLVEKRLV